MRNCSSWWFWVGLGQAVAEMSAAFLRNAGQMPAGSRAPVWHLTQCPIPLPLPPYLCDPAPHGPELLLLPSPPLRLARKTCTGLSAGGKDHDNWVLGGEAPPLPSKQPQQPKGEAQPEDGLLDPLAHKFSKTRQGRAWVGPVVLHRQAAVRVSRPLPRATPFPTLELCYFLI